MVNHEIELPETTGPVLSITSEFFISFELNMPTGFSLSGALD